MAYLGKTPSQAVRSRYYFTATGGETSLSGSDDNSNTLTFTDGNYVDVALNGVTLVAGTDYNTTTANTIGGLTALVASDVLEVVVYDTFSVFGGNIDANLNLKDNAKINFGTGNDLSIYHDPSANHSYIAESGSGDLIVSGNNIRLENSSGEYYVRTFSDGAVNLYHDNTQRIATTSTGVDVTGRITTDGITEDTSGNVGIGTTSPDSGYKLDVHGNVVFGDGGGFDMNVNGTRWQFSVGGTERMRIDSSGRLGIGTSSPSTDIGFPIGNDTKISQVFTTAHQAGNAGSIGLTISDGGNHSGVFVNNSHDGTYSDQTITFKTAEGGVSAATTRMTIEKNGRVGIGTSSPTQEIHGYSSGGDFSLRLESASATGTAYTYYKNADQEYAVGIRGSASDTFQIIDYTADATRLTIDTSGRVGIGGAPNTNWRNNLSDDVLMLGTEATFLSDSGVTTELWNNSYVNNSNVFKNISTRGASRYFQYSGQHKWFTAASASAGSTITSELNTNPKMTLDVSGNLTLHSGGLYVGGTGSANLLDDYEEGTWTPAPSTSSSTTVQSAIYTKVGRMVNVQGYVTWTNGTNNNSSDFRINGLPFAAANISLLYHAGSIGYSGSANVNDFLLIGPSANGSYIYFHQNDGDGAVHPNSTIHSRGLTSLIFSVTYMTA